MMFKNMHPLGWVLGTFLIDLLLVGFAQGKN